jgi:iron complex transport system ATP-binding protein
MALIVRNLSFDYDGKQVLRDLSFTAPAGSLTVVLGRNGSGKSTLLRVMAGILAIKSGSMKVLGEELSSLKGSARAALIGYLPQFHQTVFPFTVEDVVLTGRAAYVLCTPSASDRAKSLAAIRTIGIEHLRTRPYTELSGGERQLVMIARVLAQNPKVILLDEPVSHLDLANQQRLLGLLKKITAAGVTVVAVLHDPNSAFLYGDKIVFIKEGRVVTPPVDGNPWDPAFIEDIYGVVTEVLPFRGKAMVVPLFDNPGGSYES